MYDIYTNDSYHGVCSPTVVHDKHENVYTKFFDATVILKSQQWEHLIRSTVLYIMYEN